MLTSAIRLRHSPSLFCSLNRHIPEHLQGRKVRVSYDTRSFTEIESFIFHTKHCRLILFRKEMILYGTREKEFSCDLQNLLCTYNKLHQIIRLVLYMLSEVIFSDSFLSNTFVMRGLLLLTKIVLL